MPLPMKVVSGRTVAEEWQRLFEEHMGGCETCSDATLTDDGRRKPFLFSSLCEVGSKLAVLHHTSEMLAPS